MPEVIFNGSAGRLEGRYHPGTNNQSPIAIVLHPHPQYGGTMNNKVVYTLYKAFADAGFGVLRFNYRGVGRSEGTWDNGEGELNDAAAALDWLQSQHPAASDFWVAGFSFGSWIGMQLLMRRPEINSFISVSPPAGMYDFNFLAPCPVSGQIIHGTHDNMISLAAVQKLVTKLSAQRSIEVTFDTIDEADHFFSEKEEKLYRLASSYIKRVQSSEERDERQIA